MPDSGSTHWGQHRKAEGPAFFDQIAAVAFVDDRGDVAVGIERHLIDPVLERIARSPEHLALAGLAGLTSYTA